MGDFVRFAFMCREKGVGINAKLAIIGAGPAGLYAAGFLACQGYEVDVYDKQPIPGGLMTLAIPSWRIPPQRVLDGAKELEEKFNVKFVYKAKVYSDEPLHEEGDDLVEKRINFADLLSHYDLVLIATGTWASKLPKLPGIDAKGSTTALEYLYKWKVYELRLAQISPLVAKRVVVIGGGYSAVDAAERALKTGAESILVYRRTIKEAPAGIYEIERIKREGVEFIELASPVEVIVENGVARGVKFQKMTLGPPDETGRPKPVPVPGSEFVVEADLVVFATGESPTPPISPKTSESLGLKLNKDCSIWVNQIMQTSIPKVFAAGDVVQGPSRVGPAMRSGLKAAKYMHNWFIAKTGRALPTVGAIA